MSYVVDTNVVSELRKPACNEVVRAWWDSVDESDLYISVVALGEIRRGIERLRSRDPMQAELFERWLRGLATTFAGRVLPVSSAVADRWGRIDASRPTAVEDGLMAATAIVHGMTFVTRNVKDVAETGAQLLDPWAFSP